MKLNACDNSRLLSHEDGSHVPSPAATSDATTSRNRNFPECSAMLSTSPQSAHVYDHDIDKDNFENRSFEGRMLQNGSEISGNELRVGDIIFAGGDHFSFYDATVNPSEDAAYEGSMSEHYQEFCCFRSPVFEDNKKLNPLMDITNFYGSPVRDQSPRTPDRKLAPFREETNKVVRFAKERSPATALATYLPLTWGETPTSFLSPVTISAAMPELVSTPTKNSATAKAIKSLSVKRHKPKQPISSFQAPPLVLATGSHKVADLDWNWQAPVAPLCLPSRAIDFGENISVAPASPAPSVRPSPFSILQSLHRWHSSTNTPRVHTFNSAAIHLSDESLIATSKDSILKRVSVECLVGTVDGSARFSSALKIRKSEHNQTSCMESSMEETIDKSLKDGKQKRKRSRVHSSTPSYCQSKRRSARLL